mgnify:CR=1 FL=1
MSTLKKLDISNLEKEEEYNFDEIHKMAVVDVEVVPPRPPLAISIGKDDKSYAGVHYPLRFGTYGNISMIKGEEKARKSFLKSLILACAIGGKSNNYAEDILGHDLSDKYILDIDTEQGDYDVWLNASRIPKMVGIVPDNYKALKLRNMKSTERLEYLDWLFLESEYRSKIGICSLDGYVDFVKNFNDQEECSSFVQKLMTHSMDSKAHITGVLHLNPGSTKARGHLGTLLQNKCETVVVIKDAGEYSEVICQRARGKKFTDFTIRVNDEWLPYVSDDIIEDAQQKILLR